jgi:hypothetical protein
MRHCCSGTDDRNVVKVARVVPIAEQERNRRQRYNEGEQARHCWFAAHAFRAQRSIDDALKAASQRIDH